MQTETARNSGQSLSASILKHFADSPHNESAPSHGYGGGAGFVFEKPVQYTGTEYGITQTSELQRGLFLRRYRQE